MDISNQARCARLPASALGALADLRREAGIVVYIEGERAWVRWESGREDVSLRLMAVPGAALYERRDGHWYRLGDHLPSFGLPVESADALPIHRAILPLPIRPTPPGEGATAPARLRLVRDDRARPASALRCRLGDLARWIDMATSAQLEGLSAATEGDRVLLLGRRLPTVAGGERFWGGRVLAPLGFRPEPDLPESAVLGALGIGGGEILILEVDGCEAVPRDAFRPLTRAGVRLAVGGVAP